jgi:hypothetical protein
VYYKILKNAQIQLRFTKGFPNGEDKDVNQSGLLSSSEDRYKYTRFMAEFSFVF